MPSSDRLHYGEQMERWIGYHQNKTRSTLLNQKLYIMKQENSETHVTLEPLRTHGPDALDTHDFPALKRATLTELQLQDHNDAIGTTIRRGRNLFGQTSAGANLIPDDSTMIKAGIEMEIEGAARPHKVELRPPATILLEFPTDAPVVFPWLDKRQLRTVAALLLAIATAFAPMMGDGDDDDDDPDTDRSTHSLSV